MWYRNAYMRHLCDMHIGAWKPEFLSEFSPEEYCNNIIEAGFQSAMIYFQAHTGYCYYPTASGKMHPAFEGKENSIKYIIERLKANGIAVVGYYSLIYNNWAHDTYKEWRLVQENGMSRAEENSQNVSVESAFSDAKAGRYGLCCPNNLEYREFISKQIKEISQYTDGLDGMFFDMLFWPHICYCDSCKKRWQAETGVSMPINPRIGSNEWRLLMQKHRDWIDEFAAWATGEAKRYISGISVAHNVAYSATPIGEVCNGEGVVAASDYAGGDLAIDPYKQSFTCKYFRSISKNQPFEFMFSRCEPSLAKHTTLKSYDVMLSSVFLTAAHHGATLVIDAIDPIGTMDSKLYKQLKGVIEEEKKYERYYNGDMIADVGLYYGLNSKYNKWGDSYTNYTCVVNLTRIMIENNISIEITGIFNKDRQALDKYKMIFAPALTQDDACDNKRLIEYVNNGGVLYISGGDNEELFRELTGGKIKGITDETTTYISPCCNEDIFAYFTKKYPMSFDNRAVIVENIAKEDTIATLTLPYTKPNDVHFASIHSNPPGIFTDYPALIAKRYGKGKVIWSAIPIENAQLEVYGRIIANLVKKEIKQDLSVLSDADRHTEITLFLDSDGIYINLVHLNTEDFAKDVGSVNVSVRCKSAPASVILLPENIHMNFEYENGFVKFKTRNFKIFDMYRINFK